MNRLSLNLVTVLEAISCLAHTMPKVMLKSQTLMIDMFSVTCVVIILSMGCILFFVDLRGISEDCCTVGSISSRTATGNLDLQPSSVPGVGTHGKPK